MEEQTLGVQGSAWYNTMGQSPGGKKVPEKLVDIQGSPSVRSGLMVPSQEKFRQKHQEVCMDEQRDPGQTQTQKETYRGCKQGQVVQLEHRDIIGAARDQIGKAKA